MDSVHIYSGSQCLINELVLTEIKRCGKLCWTADERKNMRDQRFWLIILMTLTRYNRKKFFFDPAAQLAQIKKNKNSTIHIFYFIISELH